MTTDRSQFVTPDRVRGDIFIGCLVCLPSGGPIMTLDTFMVPDGNGVVVTHRSINPDYSSYKVECKCIWFEDSALRSGVFNYKSLLYYYTGK